MYSHYCRALRSIHIPRQTSRTTSTFSKAVGDISSVFPSLSGSTIAPLPPRFADIKLQIVQRNAAQLQESWTRLLSALEKEKQAIKAEGSKVVPEIRFNELNDMGQRTAFRDRLRKRGVAVVRGVVSEQEALGWKELLERYIASNPQVRGFPSTNPTVYELYWSPTQILARSHPNILRTQSFLMSHWHSSSYNALISSSHPISYADRLRVRQPGDVGFALGPHVDGGSCERWEVNGYGRGKVFDSIFEGRWEAFDPWESSCRLPVVSDLYNGAGACSTFRMFQGWLSMSNSGPGEGTLQINPMGRLATAYYLLRPFFAPSSEVNTNSSLFLRPENWTLEEPVSSALQGAVPSHCQELNSTLHPHLDLANTMVPVPKVHPGDYVAWHCDTIHGVEKEHCGSSVSSVLYIPACPLTEANARYLKHQRESFLEGFPAPDYPSGEGESSYLGRLSPEYAMKAMEMEGRQAMGLAPYDPNSPGLPEAERAMLAKSNEILGFESHL